MFWLLICLLLACALCSCLLPDSGLAQSAARAFDSTVGLLSQHSTDGHYDEELRPRRVPPRPPQGRGYLLDESYEIDHRVPLADGGSNHESNLQALLRTHHQAKSSAFARRPS